MTTHTLALTFACSYTIGQYEAAGPGFFRPMAMVRGPGDLLYVVSRSNEMRHTGKRVTIQARS